MRVTTSLYGEPGESFRCDRQLGISRSAPAFETGRKGDRGFGAILRQSRPDRPQL